MNWDQVQGKWTQVKGKAHEKWGKLTNDDLDVINGKREQFVGRLQERYGILKEEAEKQVDEFAKALDAENAAEQHEEHREAGRTRAAGHNN
jgi:uncharacterized protein YjbJ (UPF0337 family)